MKLIQDICFQNKTALVRVDFNVPISKNGIINDVTRIQSHINTINSIIEEPMHSSLTTPPQIPYITFNTIGCIIVGATSKHDIQQCRMVSFARTILCNWKCESALHEACCLFWPSSSCCFACLSFTISENGTENKSVIDIWLLNKDFLVVGEEHGVLVHHLLRIEQLFPYVLWNLTQKFVVLLSTFLSVLVLPVARDLLFF